EDRTVPSTLTIDALGNARYLASPGVNNNLTLSERIAPVGLGFRIEDVITDTAEKIKVTGAGGVSVIGSGTNQVTIPHLNSLAVDVLDGNDVVNIQSINYATDVRHSGPGVDTVNVGNAGSLQGIFGIQAPLHVEEGGAGSSTHLNVDDSADPISR